MQDMEIQCKELTYIDKLRTFIENHMKSQTDTQYPLPIYGQRIKQAKEGKKMGRNLR